MFSNTAKKKGSIRTAPWWPIVQFSSLIRSDSEKSNRLHQQFTHMRNDTAFNPPRPDRVKWHVNCQDVCFPFEQMTTTLLHVRVHRICVSELLTPPHGTKGTLSVRDKRSARTYCIFYCSLPVSWFFFLHTQTREQSIEHWRRIFLWR